MPNPPGFPATAPSPQPGQGNSPSPQRATPEGTRPETTTPVKVQPAPKNSMSSSAAFTPHPAPGTWSGWTPRPGSSHQTSNGSCRSGTTPAAPRTATPPSGTMTTSLAGRTAAPRVLPTAKASAKPATTPKKTPAGPSCPSPGPGNATPPQPPPPQATPTTPPPHHSPAPDWPE